MRIEFTPRVMIAAAVGLILVIGLIAWALSRRNAPIPVPPGGLPPQAPTPPPPPGWFLPFRGDE